MSERLATEMSLSQCKDVVDDLSVTFRQWDMPTSINLTGGDPTLWPDLVALIEYAVAQGHEVSVLGNPTHIDATLAERLKHAGVSTYQVSLDGLESTHDRLRGRSGSYRDTLRAIQVLKEANLAVAVMSTVSKSNENELPAVARVASAVGADCYDFARLVPTGSGEGLAADMLSAADYRNFLLRMMMAYRQLEGSGSTTYFGAKDGLWNLLFWEMGLLDVDERDPGTVYDGCGVGCSILTLMPDGTYYPCRRLPIQIGHASSDTMEGVLLDSAAHDELRNIEAMKLCGKCELLQYCRGCPGVAYAVHGDYRSPDPQCWKASCDD
jgi:radical SAM protein with 4Fe4S-binding SPASM domain